MDCASCRETISAQLDGEASSLATAAAEHHLASCVACRRNRDGVVALHRLVRVAPADDVPDLTARILERIRPA